MYYTRRRSPLVLSHFASGRTATGQTPTMFATTSHKECTDKSRVTTTPPVCLEPIQSLCTARFHRVARNSFIEKDFGLPQTTEPHFTGDTS